MSAGVSTDPLRTVYMYLYLYIPVNVHTRISTYTYKYTLYTLNSRYLYSKTKPTQELRT